MEDNKRTVVVTGSSGGIGMLTAKAFVADGWRTYGTMRDPDGKNRGPAKQLRDSGATVVALDVTNGASVDAAAALIHAQSGAVDVIVNNAGAGFFGIQEAFTPEAVEAQFATNVVGPLRVNRAFLPAMREARSGLVIYISSVVGRLVIPFGGVYVASKHALEALAEVSSYELKPFRVDVAIVEPGAFPTEINYNPVGADDAERITSYGEEAKNVAALKGAMHDAMDGRDPGDVATAVVAIANAPAGQRPLRTTVPHDDAVEAINSMLSSVETQVLANFGFGALLPKVLA